MIDLDLLGSRSIDNTLAYTDATSDSVICVITTSHSGGPEFSITAAMSASRIQLSCDVAVF